MGMQFSNTIPMQILFLLLLAIYFLKLNNLLTVIPAVNDYFACPLGAHVEFFLLIIK